MRRKNALGAVLAWRITTMWFGLAIVFRESGLKNQVTRLLLDLVGETLKCLSILHWCENMSWMSGMRMSPLTGLTTKDGAFFGWFTPEAGVLSVWWLPESTQQQKQHGL